MPFPPAFRFTTRKDACDELLGFLESTPRLAIPPSGHRHEPTNARLTAASIAAVLALDEHAGALRRILLARDEEEDVRAHALEGLVRLRIELTVSDLERLFADWVAERERETDPRRSSYGAREDFPHYRLIALLCTDEQLDAVLPFFDRLPPATRAALLAGSCYANRALPLALYRALYERWVRDDRALLEYAGGGRPHPTEVAAACVLEPEARRWLLERHRDADPATARCAFSRLARADLAHLARTLPEHYADAARALLLPIPALVEHLGDDELARLLEERVRDAPWFAGERHRDRVSCLEARAATLAVLSAWRGALELVARLASDATLPALVRRQLAAALFEQDPGRAIEWARALLAGPERALARPVVEAAAHAVRADAHELYLAAVDCADDPVLRLFGVEGLDRTRAEESPALAALASDPNAIVRVRALVALARRGAESALGELRDEAVKATDVCARALALWGLALVDADRHVDLLEHSVREDRETITNRKHAPAQHEAALGLARVGTPAALTSLVHAIAATASWRAEPLLAVLGWSLERQANAALPEPRLAWRRAAQSPLLPGYGRLAEWHEAHDLERRAREQRGSKSPRAGGVDGAAAPALSEPHVEQARRAVVEKTSSPEALAVESATRCTEGDPRRTQPPSIDALCWTSRHAVVDELLALIRSTSPLAPRRERGSAASLVEALAEESHAAQLRQILLDRAEERSVRQCALTALIRLRASLPLEDLQSLLEECLVASVDEALDERIGADLLHLVRTEAELSLALPFLERLPATDRAVALRNVRDYGDPYPAGVSEWLYRNWHDVDRAVLERARVGDVRTIDVALATFERPESRALLQASLGALERGDLGRVLAHVEPDDLEAFLAHAPDCLRRAAEWLDLPAPALARVLGRERMLALVEQRTRELDVHAAQCASVRALERLGFADDLDDLWRLRAIARDDEGALERALSAARSPALRDLLAGLRRRPAGLSLASLQQVVAAPLPEHRPLLFAALESHPAGWRYLALEALARLGEDGPAWRAHLERATRDPHAMVRIAARGGLACRGDAKSVAFLRHAARSGRHVVLRAEALRRLGEADPVRHADLALALLAEDHDDGYYSTLVAHEAALWLLRLATPAALSACLRARLTVPCDELSWYIEDFFERYGDWLERGPQEPRPQPAPPHWRWRGDEPFPAARDTRD